MKKIILLTPLLVVPALMGCNKNPTYLELWSKEIHYEDDIMRAEATAKIEGKHQVEIDTTKYDVDGKTPTKTTKETITYNDHDDIKTIVSEQHSVVSNITDVTTTTNYTYDYRDDGLISKMTIDNSSTTGFVSKAECTYEYDDLKRLTQEKRTRDNEPVYESNSTYNTKFNIYSYNKTWDVDLGDYWRTTTNTINDAGDVIESIEAREDKNGSINKSASSRKVSTYDEYHCPIHVELFVMTTSTEWKKIGTIDSTFHKNKPNKLLKSTINRMNVTQNIEYTYDEYDRKTSYLEPSPESLFVKKDETKWEYDQVIPA